MWENATILNILDTTREARKLINLLTWFVVHGKMTKRNQLFENVMDAPKLLILSQIPDSVSSILSIKLSFWNFCNKKICSTLWKIYPNINISNTIFVMYNFIVYNKSFNMSELEAKSMDYNVIIYLHFSLNFQRSY